jgi:hypothetical protein
LISAFLSSLDKTSSGGGSLTDWFHCYNCLDFQPFNLSTFQKRVVRTKFDIYVLISMNIDIEPYISAFLLSLDKTSSGGGSLTDWFHCYNLSSLVHIAFLWLQSNNTCYGSSRLVKALINFILYSNKNVTILFWNVM